MDVARAWVGDIGQMTSGMAVRLRQAWLAAGVVLLGCAAPAGHAVAQQQRPPNILVIMGDDVGCFSIGAYHQGIMSGTTPNLDRLANEGL